MAGSEKCVIFFPFYADYLIFGKSSMCGDVTLIGLLGSSGYRKRIY